MRSLSTFLIVLLVPHITLAEHRSSQARTEFKRLHPCPSTGKSKGACPGYIIDHVVPLACGGPDRPSNMQWQTVADAKAKDKWERNGCEHPAASREK